MSTFVDYSNIGGELWFDVLACEGSYHGDQREKFLRDSEICIRFLTTTLTMGRRRKPYVYPTVDALAQQVAHCKHVVLRGEFDFGAGPNPPLLNRLFDLLAAQPALLHIELNNNENRTTVLDMMVQRYKARAIVFVVDDTCSVAVIHAVNRAMVQCPRFRFVSNSGRASGDADIFRYGALTSIFNAHPWRCSVRNGRSPCPVELDNATPRFVDQCFISPEAYVRSSRPTEPIHCRDILIPVWTDLAVASYRFCRRITLIGGGAPYALEVAHGAEAEAMLARFCPREAETMRWDSREMEITNRDAIRRRRAWTALALVYRLTKNLPDRRMAVPMLDFARGAIRRCDPAGVALLSNHQTLRAFETLAYFTHSPSAPRKRPAA